MNKKAFTLLLIGLLLIITLGTVLLLSDLNKNDEDIIIPKTGLYDYSILNKTGKYYAYEDDRYTSLAGIDVSEHNKKIDFKKVKESGIDFVFIRIGWRGYTEGVLHADTNFETYFKNARDNGLLIGVYFFSQATNEEEAIAEAEMVLKTLNGRKLDLPVVYDFENITGDEARTDGITREQCTKNALAFLGTVSKEYEVMLYANSNLIRNYYDTEAMKDYRLWYAQYNEIPEYKDDFCIWQYSDKGEVPGIEKETDLNIMFIEKQK